jgi:hypothetical protein
MQLDIEDVMNVARAYKGLNSLKDATYINFGSFVYLDLSQRGLSNEELNSLMEDIPKASQLCVRLRRAFHLQSDFWNLLQSLLCHTLRTLSFDRESCIDGQTLLALREVIQ